MNNRERISIARDFINHHKESIKTEMHATALEPSDYINIYHNLAGGVYGVVTFDIVNQINMVEISSLDTGCYVKIFEWPDPIKLKKYRPISANVLKKRAEDRGSFYFDKVNMRATGESMSNYIVNVDTVLYKGIQCYELLRRKPTKFGLDNPAYFDCTNYDLVIEDD